MLPLWGTDMYKVDQAVRANHTVLPPQAHSALAGRLALAPQASHSGVAHSEVVEVERDEVLVLAGRPSVLAGRLLLAPQASHSCVAHTGKPNEK